MNKIDLRKIDLNLLYLFEILMSEGSVSKAAHQLGRTQSAISHALGRLREQLGDPLLVKTNGRMQPSPYALELAEEIRPILRNIERILRPRQHFDAATSSRQFSLAVPDIALNLFPRLVNCLHKEAPSIQIEWQTPQKNTLSDVAEGLIDLTLLPAAVPRPDGIAHTSAGSLKWACFMRGDHPALRDWSLVQWSSWPHILVGTGDQLRSPVTEAIEQAKIKRHIGMVVPNFGAVAPLLATTDMIATLPSIILADALEQFAMAIRQPPFSMPSMPHVIAWSSRLTCDPASQWLRDHFTSIFQECLDAADRLLLD